MVIRSTEGREQHNQQWRVVASAFGEPVDDLTDEQFERNQRLVDARYSIAAYDHDEIIGGTVGVSFELVMPGGARLPMNGVAGVGVAPNRTGRGAMRGLMEETIKRSLEAGAAGSVLMASEAPLYSRFGYGCAFSWASYTLDVGHAQLRHPAEDDGTIDLLTDRVAAKSVMLGAYDDIIANLPGQLTRDDIWWELMLNDTADWMGPAKPVVALHRNAHGQPDGYALYTVAAWEGDGPISSSVVKLREIVAANTEADAALWQFLTTIPLVRRIDWEFAPVEPRLRHLLVDSRQLRTTGVSDHLWLRPLDVPLLLTSRSYLSDGEISLGIIDDLVPSNVGPWQLTVRAGQAEVSEIQHADIELTAEQFGAVLLGGTSVFALADAGLVRSGDRSACAELDRLLRVDSPPFSVSKF